MKNTAILLLTLLAFASCSDDTDPVAVDPNPLPDGYVYASSNGAIAGDALQGDQLFFGKVVVETIATGETYTDEATRFELTDPQDTDHVRTVRLCMHETRFAAAMPAMDMEVPEVEYSLDGTRVGLSGERLVPEIAQTPYERYVMTELAGSIEGVSLHLEFVCAGMFRVVYDGRLIVRD